jgi:hypothetical protein
MDQPLIALVFYSPQQPSYLTRRQPQQPGRLLLLPFSLDHPVQHLQSILLATTHLDPLAFLADSKHRVLLAGGKKDVLSSAKKRTLLLR